MRYITTSFFTVDRQDKICFVSFSFERAINLMSYVPCKPIFFLTPSINCRKNPTCTKKKLKRLPRFIALCKLINCCSFGMKGETKECPNQGYVLLISLEGSSMKKPLNSSEE